MVPAKRFATSGAQKRIAVTIVNVYVKLAYPLARGAGRNVETLGECIVSERLISTGKDEEFEKVEQVWSGNVNVFHGERHEVLEKDRIRESSIHEKRLERSNIPTGAVQFQSLHAVPRVLDDLAQAILTLLILL
ncbi:hypothetical protein N9L76_10160 [bacterium]|nr:hypothetical protein [bacterium]